MNKLLIVSIFCTLLFISCTKKDVLSIGENAPVVKVMDLKDNVKTTKSNGKVLMLRFWQKGCASCLEEMPRLDNFYKKYKDKVEVYSIFMGDDTKYVKQFKKESGFSFPFFTDQLSVATKKYKVFSSPTSFLIDKKGKLRKAQLSDNNIENFYELTLDLTKE